MNKDKATKFGLGMIIGLIVGVISALFMAPKSGKELREDAKKAGQDIKKRTEEYKKLLADKKPNEVAKMIFGSASKRSQAIYAEAKVTVADGLANLRVNLQDIDNKKYKKIVTDAIKTIKKEHKITTTQLKKLGKALEADFKKLGQQATKTTTTTKAKTSKAKDTKKETKLN